VAKSKTRQGSNELKTFQRKRPKADVVDLLIADITGVLRGKRVRHDEFASLYKDGFSFPGGTVLLDTLGDCVPGIQWSSDDGDPDVDASVVRGSLAPVPWARKPSGQALFRLYTQDGRPFFADPRYLVERALEPLSKMGLKVVMACELEFYLLEANAAQPTPSVSRVPGTNRPQPGPQVYNPDDLWDIDEFLNDLNDVCNAQKIPAGTATSEFAPGQFEINLHHIDDPVLACDHAILLKRAIKAVARRHGYVACFMAKPFEEDSGSGLHIHMSLYDKDGKNYFSQGKEKMALPPYSARFRHAIGGLAKTMADATAIFAPNANSYRRLRPEMFAPVEPNWGTNHRNVALRVPVSGEKNLRIEHRVSGADANPYLVTAAILAGIHYGLKNRCDPGRMVEEGEVLRLKQKIPGRWDTALDKMSRSKVLADYLGSDFCEAYIANRRDESRRFHNTVSELDFDWYLRAV
jgi:glutamine synthetase